MIKHTEECKQEVVRIALTSGLPHEWGRTCPQIRLIATARKLDERTEGFR